MHSKINSVLSETQKKVLVNFLMLKEFLKRSQTLFRRQKVRKRFFLGLLSRGFF